MEMDKLQAFVKVRAGSLFQFFPPELAQQLADQCELLWYRSGEEIQRSPGPRELFIVVDGEIGLYEAGNRNKRIDRVIVGRSLELPTLLKGKQRWDFDWYADTRVGVLKLEFAAFDAMLSRFPPLKDYLVKITCNPELQRFKNDIHMFGLPNAYLPGTFKEMVPMRFNDFFRELGEQGTGLIIMRKGELAFHAEFEGRRQKVGEFRDGDYFVWKPERSDLRIDVSADAQVWWLDFGRWAQSVKSNKISFFIKLIDPMGQKLAARLEESERPKAPSADAGSQGDGASRADDGLSDLEPEEFCCSEKELARLRRRKPRIILQHEEMDCGAACLASIAWFYGRKISVPTFRSLVTVTRDGASLLSLLKAAEHVGMQALGLKLEYDDMLDLRIPFVTLGAYHFVVAYRVEEKRILIGDPGVGLLWIEREEFETAWSGFVLALKVTPSFYEFPESEPSFKKYLRLMDGFKLPMAEILMASLLVMASGLALPLFMQYIFDGVLVEQKANHLHGAAMAILGITVVSSLTSWSRNYLTAHLISRLDAKFSSLFLKHVYDLPLAFFSVRRVGDITSRLNDIEWVREIVTRHSIEIFIGLATAALYTAILFLYSWKLVIPIAVVAPLLLGALALMFSRLEDGMHRLFQKRSKSDGMAFEHFNALESVKSLNAQVPARWRWEMMRVQSLVARRQVEVTASLILGIASFFQEITGLAALLLAVFLFLRGELTLGQVVAASGLITGIVASVSLLVARWKDFTQVAVSLERIDDIFTAAPERGARDSEHAGIRLKGEIELRNVSFRYGGDFSERAISDVSLKVMAGEKVAFVGRSGSGKTTLGYMINLLYTPTEGQILVDGVDTTRIPLAKLRSQVGMIIQDNNVLSGSVLENITMGDPHPSFSRAVKAAKAADAHDFITKLSESYSTVLGEGGVGLSAGQRQKLNIARAIYREPSILIMDEATSALDAVSEETIVQNLKALPGVQTSIIIAHRLNTVIHADRIVVLEGGRIVETGTHKELMLKQGAYCRLFKNQLYL